ncbi:LysR family transcriptional regulator [Pseudooceanicola sp. C21-150M6]|uniref:LysR family transcriptional regulator n=1 Tax=Pseudooceanicola sp. C21-150M6 TaxID=3434355 RepID=UPI003D7FFC6D
MLDEIALFIQIVRSNGLAAAATHLDMSAATVTRHLSRLEDHLGCRLIHRSARRFELTTEGESYYREMAELVDQMQGRLRGLGEDIHRIGGNLTVAAPTNLAVTALRDLWSGFLRDYPEVRLDIRLSNSFADLQADHVDIALRVGPMPDSGFLQQRVGRVSTILSAAPAYLDRHGTPDTPADLAHHRIIGVTTLPHWDLTHDIRGESLPLKPVTAAVADDIGFAAQLAEDGLGILLLPVSEIGPQIRDGRLVHVLPGWRGPDRIIHLVWPAGRLLSARARLFRDYTRAHISADPWLQGGLPQCDPSPDAM